MPTPVEHSLSQLLPTHTVHRLPLELIALATSLLAASRSKAASLKPEEEIGRTFACAHIACERLKNRLALELANPAPAPVKPKVYQKLFDFLNAVLDAPRTPKAGRPAARNVTASGSRTPGSRSQKSTTGVTTPSKSAPRTPNSVLGKRLRETDAEPDSPVLDFVRLATQHVCTQCSQKPAMPHVFVGVSSVAKEIGSRTVQPASSGSIRKRGRPPKKKVEEQVQVPSGGVPRWKYPSLVVAIFVLVVARMLGIELTDKAKISLLRADAEVCMQDYCTRSNDEVIRSVSKDVTSSVGFYLLEAEDSGWLNMEWYENVPEGVFDDQEDDRGGDDDDDGDPEIPRKAPAKTPLRRAEKHGKRKYADGEDEDPGAVGLLSGLATMFQPAVDWLSDERRAKYAQWKNNLLRGIVAVEKNSQAVSAQ